MTRLPAALAAAALLATGLAGSAPAFSAQADTGAPDIQITEFAYGGNAAYAGDTGDGEYVELTNVGSAAQDFSGWFYNTAASTAGGIDLSSFGTVAAGESVIVTDLTAADFRTEWNLKDSVRVINDGAVTLNSKAKTIYVLDSTGATVDSLAETGGDLGGKGVGARVDAGHLADASAAIGTNWTIGTAGDAEGSWTSANGAIGSPGASTQGTSTPADVTNATDPGDGGTDPGDGGTTVDPNWADISINEISSDNDVAGIVAGGTMQDPVELYNKGAHDVDITGWLASDSGGAAAAKPIGDLYVNGSTSPSATRVIPAGGFAVFHSPNGLSSGGDAVAIFLPDGTSVDDVDYAAGNAGVDESANTDHTFKSLAAVPDGSGSFYKMTAATFGATNGTTPGAAPGTPDVSDVPCSTEAPSATTAPVAGALAWPGGSTVAVADAVCSFIGGGTGQDVSGLVFDPTAPGILWAVKNKSVVYKLHQVDGIWQKVTDGDWGNGKNIVFPNGAGLPDSEGMTVGPDGALYITTERDNSASSVPLDSVLRFDPTQSGTTLTATDQWDLTGDNFATTDSADSNLGFEGVTWVPDSYLTKNGFIDRTGGFYTPANYPDKTTAGLFFAAVEKTGHLKAYALNSNHSYALVADIATGMAGVMDVSYDADLQRIWAQCDNTCGVTASLLKIGSDGAFVAEKRFTRPAGLPDNNFEGFAVAPVATAVGGKRQVVWSDDGNFGTSATGVATLADNGGHSLWAGTIDIGLGLGAQGYVTKTLKSTPTPAVSGTKQIGTALVAKPGTWDAGVTTSYVWLNGASVLGSNAPLTVTAAIAGKTVTLVVVGTKPGYAPVTKTLAVAIPLGTLAGPAPTISGTPKVESTLTAKAGTWTSGTALSYQWYSGGVKISGATKSTFVLTAAQYGHTMTVKVTGTKAGYAALTKTSAPTGTVAAGTLRHGTAAITGTARVGSKLTATRGTWTSGTAFSYQWYSGGKAIAHATGSSFTPTTAQQGHTITVKVTGKKTGYASYTSTSKATKAVAKK